MSLPQGILGAGLALGLAATNIFAGVGSATVLTVPMAFDVASVPAATAPMWTGEAAVAVLHAKWGPVIPRPAAADPQGDSGAGDGAGSGGVVMVGGRGIPGHLQRAYVAAAAAAPQACRLTPAFLAAIGEVESGNLAGRVVGDDHVARPGVYGPDLTGGPYANIADTDGGALDGVSAWDRAVGPMQFIPGTWASWGSDGDGDGRADPQNVYDAALSAARYLCAGGRDLSTPAGITAALWSYNQSVEYAAVVRSWFAWFSANGVTVGSGGRDVLAAAQPAPSAGSPTPTAVVPNSPETSPAATTSAAATTSPTAATSPSTSVSATPTASSTWSPSPSSTATATPSPSPTWSCPVMSGSPTATVSGSPSPSSSLTPSATVTPTPTSSPSAPCVAAGSDSAGPISDPAAQSAPASTVSP